MLRIGFRETLGLLILATVAVWAYQGVSYFRDGSISLLFLSTGLLLTGMLTIWPFFNGKRLANGRVESAHMCVDCKSPVWPTEHAIGFCLRCGSTKPSVPASA